MPNLDAKAGNINLANYIDTFARPLAGEGHLAGAWPCGNRINWRPPLFYTHSQNNVRQAVSCQGSNGDREIGISPLDNQISALNRRSWRLTSSDTDTVAVAVAVEVVVRVFGFGLRTRLRLHLRLSPCVGLRPRSTPVAGNGHQFARLPMMLLWSQQRLDQSQKCRATDAISMRSTAAFVHAA